MKTNRSKIATKGKIRTHYHSRLSHIYPSSARHAPAVRRQSSPLHIGVSPDSRGATASVQRLSHPPCTSPATAHAAPPRWLLDRAGFDVRGEDLRAMRIDGAGRPVVYRGIPRLKLWEASLALLERSSEALEKVASDINKFHVPLDSVDDLSDLAPLLVERLYLLDRRDEADGALFVPVAGVAAAGIVLDNSFRWNIGQSVAGRDSRAQFDQALAIARGAAVFRLARRGGERIMCGKRLARSRRI